MNTAPSSRRRCLQGLAALAAGACAPGTEALALGGNARHGVAFVDHPEAEALARAYCKGHPGAARWRLDRATLQDLQAWQSLAQSMRQHRVFAVLDARAALLWPLLVAPQPASPAVGDPGLPQPGPGWHTFLQEIR